MRTRHGPGPTPPSLDEGEGGEDTGNSTGSLKRSSSMFERSLASDQNGSLTRARGNELSTSNEELQDLVRSDPRYDTEIEISDRVTDDHRILVPQERQD